MGKLVDPNAELRAKLWGLELACDNCCYYESCYHKQSHDGVEKPAEEYDNVSDNNNHAYCKFFEPKHPSEK